MKTLGCRAVSLMAKAMMFCLFGLLSVALGADKVELPRVAIIQLANHTINLKVQDKIAILLRESLDEMGYDIVHMDSLRAGMRANRLRLVGEIDSAGTDQIVSQTGAEILLTGSVDIYLEQENPEVAISLRAYDCERHRIIWVDCESTTGEDQAGLFGVGRMTDIDKLTARVVETLLERMPTFGDTGKIQKHKPSKNDAEAISQGRIAIVQFDNSTEFAQADAVVTNAVMLEAWRRGYDIVEPGELSRIRTRLASDFQGGISDTALQILRDEFGVAMVVTGSVTSFLPNRGAAIESVPEIEFTMRTIDPAGGEIMSSLSIERDGAANETIFGSGRALAIGEVARQAVRGGWDELIAGWLKRKSASPKTSIDGDQNAQR